MLGAVKLFITWLLDLLISLLPLSPFATVSSFGYTAEILSYVNWFIDFDRMAGFFNLWLLALLAYWLAQWVIDTFDIVGFLTAKFQNIYSTISTLGGSQ